MRSGSVRWVVLERGDRTLNLTNSTWSAFGVSIYCVVSSLLVPFFCFCSKWSASLCGTNDSRRSLLLLHLSRQSLTVLRSFTAFLTSLMRRKKLSRKCLLNLTTLQVPLANHMYICSERLQRLHLFLLVQVESSDIEQDPSFCRVFTYFITAKIYILVSLV